MSLSGKGGCVDLILTVFLGSFDRWVLYAKNMHVADLLEVRVCTEKSFSMGKMVRNLYSNFKQIKANCIIFLKHEKIHIKHTFEFH